MTSPPPTKRGWCFACGQTGDLRLVRTQPTVKARKWKCVACIERSQAFKASRQKANENNDLAQASTPAADRARPPSTARRRKKSESDQ